MSDSVRKPLFTVQVAKQADGLKHFADKGASPSVMLCAHFIDKLPAILKSSAWIGAAVVAAIKLWPR